MEVDLRKYEECAEILSELGLRRLRFISNNPEKIAAVKKSGFEIVERVSIPIKYCRMMSKYIKTKQHRMGHLLDISVEFFAR